SQLEQLLLSHQGSQLCACAAGHHRRKKRGAVLPRRFACWKAIGVDHRDASPGRMHAEHTEDKIPPARPRADEETIQRLMRYSGLQLGPNEAFRKLNVVSARSRSRVVG